MFQMVNGFLYQYCMQLTCFTEIERKTVYERDSENKRKRKKIKDEYNRTETWVIIGNGGEEIIRFRKKNSDSPYEVIKWSNHGWETIHEEHEDEPMYNYIESVCARHYLEKYGEQRPAYSSWGRKKYFKRLTMAEKADWFEEFRRLDLTISDVENIISENRMLKKQNDEFRDIFLIISNNKRVKKIVEKQLNDF